MRPISMLLLAGTTLCGVAHAQLTVSSPSYSVQTLATGIAATGEDLAVDRFGNVFLTDTGAGTSFTTSITRVAPDGTVFPADAGTFGVVGQLAYNPTDGFVYAVDYAPVLPVILSTVWRLEPTGGATQVFFVDVVADGMTIANDGTFYFGGMGLLGPGLYSSVPGGLGAVATLESSGFGSNSMLQSMTDGSVLIADGDAIERWVPGSAVPTPFYDASPFITPNQFSAVVGLGRGPMNALGRGALFGVNSITTVCICGTATAVAAGPLGESSVPAPSTFAAQDFSLFGPAGLRSFATGIRQDAYWLFEGDSATPPGSPGLTLTRIAQLPAAGEPGSLFVGVTPQVLSFDLYGPGAGGDPFLLGLRLGPTPSVAGAFYAPWGFLDLDPFGPGYIAFLDGMGVFGAPNPFGVTPPGGNFQLDFPLPGGLSGIPLDAQFLMLSTDAPNGLFHVSNAESFTLL